MAKCWKCGKEIHGYQASLVGLSTCPECETLALLKKMHEEQQANRSSGKCGGSSLDEDDDDDDGRPYVPKPSDYLAPYWWKRASNPKSSGVAAFLAFFFGEWGFPFIYIGKGWATVGIGIFIVFVALLIFSIEKIISSFFIFAYFVITNFLVAAIFVAMDEEDFLKKFRYDLWVDKQIANQYGHKVDECGYYTDIPLNKPSWEEAFPSKRKEASQENPRTSDVPSDDGATKPKVRLRIVK